MNGFEVAVCLENSRRWSSEGSSPDLNLLSSKLLDGFFFVLASQVAVMSLVQSPRVINWNVLLPERLENRIAGLVRPLQKRSVSRIEFVIGI